MSEPWRSRGKAHVFGDDIVHDGFIVPVRVIGARITDPAVLATHLFEESRPALREMALPGDFIVGGRNFGSGKPHTAGYIAMQAKGLRVLCESMPLVIIRATMNLGLPVLSDCPGLTQHVQDGDDIEVDYASGTVINHTRGTTCQYAPLSERVREMIDAGGLRGSLAQYLQDHPELGQPYEADVPAKAQASA